VRFDASRDEFVHVRALLQIRVPLALERAVAMTNCGQRSTASYSLLVSVDCANSLAEPGSPQWFAVAVKPRFDKAVARTLESKGFETLLPLYKAQHRYAARSKVSELPLFPGYVFCRFNVLTRLPILTTPGVTQILGTGNTPTALSEEEIVSLQAAIQAGFPLHPFPFVQTGERVRIDQGALRGVVGLVVKMKGSLRLILSVTLLQRSVLLEIDRHQVSRGTLSEL
jgi:transcription antitermination factor NusG